MMHPFSQPEERNDEIPTADVVLETGHVVSFEIKAKDDSKSADGPKITVTDVTDREKKICGKYRFAKWMVYVFIAVCVLAVFGIIFGSVCAAGACHFDSSDTTNLRFTTAQPTTDDNDGDDININIDIDVDVGVDVDVDVDGGSDTDPSTSSPVITVVATETEPDTTTEFVTTTSRATTDEDTTTIYSDLSATPLVVGSVEDEYDMPEPRGVATKGDYIYVASYDDNALVIIDYKNPTNPSIVSRVVDADSGYGENTDGILLGGLETVAVYGDYVFVGGYECYMQIFDVSDKENPTFVGGVGTSHRIMDIEVSNDGGTLYVAAYGNVDIIDVSDRTSPQLTGSINSHVIEYCGALAVNGDKVYVVKSDMLAVLDVSDKTDPTVIGVLEDNVHFETNVDIAISSDGNYVYTSGNYITVVDVSDVDDMKIVDTLDNTYSACGCKSNCDYGCSCGDPSMYECDNLYQKIVITNDDKYLFVSEMDGNSMFTIDITDPERLVRIGEIIDDQTNIFRPRGITVSDDGRYAIVTGENSDTVAIINVFGNWS